jgi:two-component system KDP operon response regulator KdpE
MLSRPRILVANDDPGICRLLQRHFGTSGYTVVIARTARETLELTDRKPPDLAILSTGLDESGGTELLHRVRSMCTAPIIALTRPGDLLTPAQILDLGADDCIEEPFLLRELAARARRLLQRSGAEQAPSVLATWLGPIEIHPLERRVKVGNKLVAMTRKEFDVLALLVGAKGGTLSHDEIVQKVWSPGHSGARQNLRRTISSLRQKIEPDAGRPANLLSVRGSGYRLRVRLGDVSGAEPSDGPSDSVGSGSRSR